MSLSILTPPVAGRRAALLAPALMIVLHPSTAWACAACFGKSDSSLARGMNMGILSLLLMVGFMLSAVAGFFVFLARRSAKTAANLEAPKVPETIVQS